MNQLIMNLSFATRKTKTKRDSRWELGGKNGVEMRLALQWRNPIWSFTPPQAQAAPSSHQVSPAWAP